MCVCCTIIRAWGHRCMIYSVHEDWFLLASAVSHFLFQGWITDDWRGLLDGLWPQSGRDGVSGSTACQHIIDPSRTSSSVHLERFWSATRSSRNHRNTNPAHPELHFTFKVGMKQKFLFPYWFWLDFVHWGIDWMVVDFIVQQRIESPVNKAGYNQHQKMQRNIIILPSGSIYKLKRSGPSIEPWGTPLIIWAEDEKKIWELNLCVSQ